MELQGGTPLTDGLRRYSSPSALNKKPTTFPFSAIASLVGICSKNSSGSFATRWPMTAVYSAVISNVAAFSPLCFLDVILATCTRSSGSLSSPVPANSSMASGSTRPAASWGASCSGAG